jgi:hypothetical protein
MNYTSLQQFNLNLKRIWTGLALSATRGCFPLVRTGSARSMLWCVRSKVIWAARIVSYPFDKWSYQIRWILIERPWSKEGRGGYLGFTVDAGDVIYTLEEIGGDVLVTPGRWRCCDGAQRGTANSRAWSVSLNSSCRKGEERLELDTAAVWSWAWTAVSAIEEMMSCALTRRSSSSRRVWWRDRKARGARTAGQWLAGVAGADGSFGLGMISSLWGTLEQTKMDGQGGVVLMQGSA